MKKAIAEDDSEDTSAQTFKGGRDGFYFSGTNGRWRGVLTDEDLDLYEEAKRRVLSPECAAYLEQGDASGVL